MYWVDSPCRELQILIHIINAKRIGGLDWSNYLSSVKLQFLNYKNHKNKRLKKENCFWPIYKHSIMLYFISEKQAAGNYNS